MLGTIGIYGVGLIGGSLGMALRKSGVSRRVIGIGRDTRRLERARELGAVDEHTLDLSEVAEELDILVLCTPLSVYGSILERHGHRLTSRTLVTDAGSVKVCAVAALEAGLPSGVPFVGAHPMAGAETTGVESARADLYEGAVCALCPTPRTDAEVLTKASAFWESVGCTVVRIAPEVHDRAVAYSSHLVHLAAAALAEAVFEGSRDCPEVRMVLGSGFRDTTRIAGGDPVMWRDICTGNREAIQASMDRFEAVWREIRDALTRGNSVEIEEILSRVQTHHREVLRRT